MKKILITGANGQVGSELKDVFKDRVDLDTFFLDRNQLPLDQTAIIQDIFGMYQPDVIIHCAAYTAVDKAETEQDMADKVNHLASEEIAIYCRLNNVKLIAISTDYVFDGESSQPMLEDAPVAPINTYGITKLKGEQAIKKWQPESIIIRTSWVYSVYGNNFVKTMVRLMNEREEISVIDDQIGSPTYALDLAKAVAHILDGEQWIPGIYHFSNEGEISWYDFAAEIKNIKGIDCKINPIPTASYPTPAKRPKFSLLDKKKIKETFGVVVPEWKKSLRYMLNKI
ncbi:dTDP-4-dehydrorhamnose reductase [Sphingobacterium bovistauri]|uniref:dTDP-4-dehydrorhamnose reductase n=1 Tax=Sphingobacterium bovistauri TaxID=2781959 RepID=A0ABS7Z5Q6_9SPHI|nr:dTDP-4-dehydrorhamnose reductase [Sphingobacterium bovistauri]MCA5004079.1 dTDP-4-dehydrorhamnose reductase [Sphingobacterium bovistauri]